MKIQYLKIKDFKNLSDVEINDFSRVNIFSGDNGSGKSSILEAIIFCLTNNLQSKIEEYVKWGKKSFLIQIKFSHTGMDFDYTIEGGKSTKRRLIVNENEEYNQSEATKHLEDIIDSELALFSAISMQGKSTELLFEKPSPRLQKLKRILKIEKLNDISNQIKADIKEIENSIDVVDGEIRTLEARKFEFDEVPSLPNINVTKLETKKSQLEKDRNQYQIELQQYERYKKELELYNKAQNNITEYQKEIEEIRKEIDKLESQSKEVPEFEQKSIRSTLRQISQIEKDITSFKTEEKFYKDYLEKKESSISKIEKLSKSIKDLVFKRLPRKVISQSDIDLLNEKYFTQKSEIDTDEKHLKIIESDGVCPTCLRPFEIDVKKFKEDIKVKKDSIEFLTKEINTLKEELDKIDKINQHNKECEILKQSYESQLQKQEEELQSLKVIAEPDYSILEDLQKTLKELEQQKEDYENQEKEYNRIIEFNNDIIKKANEYKDQLTIVTTKLAEYSLIKKPKDFNFTVSFDENKYKEICDSINNYRSIEKDIERVNTYNEKIKTEKKENQIKIAEKNDAIFEKRSKISILKDTQKILYKDFSSYLVDKASEYIKEKMNEFFQRAYGKYQIQYEQDGKGIEFYYSDNSTDWHSVNMLSGYEKQLFGVAFRIALSSLQDLSFMLVDEVDSDSSDYNSVELYKTLLQEQIDQFFIVTHKEETKEFLYNNSENLLYYIQEGKIN